MKKTNHFVFLFASLVFIFSCNTEQKFAFRDKIKVGEQPQVEAKVNQNITKSETIHETHDSIETNQATASTAKNSSPEIQEQKLLSANFIVVEKIIADSTVTKKKNEDPLPEKKLNLPALLGLILGLIDLIGFIGALVFLLSDVGDFIFTLGILSFIGLAAIIFSVIGFKQIYSNPEEKGFVNACLGLIFGLFSICVSLFALWLSYMLSTGP
ncbi:MAG: hypothetical protein ACHQK8_05155 [Bacteroidia bacterium]